jgi:hypothetical protein
MLRTILRTHQLRYVVRAALLTLPLLAACVKANPPTDTGDPIASTPTSPTAPSTNTPADPATGAGQVALAYVQDMRTLFASDCTMCHGSGRADGNYRMSTYAQVMTAVRPGNPSSTLVVVTQPGGSMYRYWSGGSATRSGKAAAVRSWVVTYNAQENR